jgi:hypothetical protein
MIIYAGDSSDKLSSVGRAAPVLTSHPASVSTFASFWTFGAHLKALCFTVPRLPDDSGKENTAFYMGEAWQASTAPP